MDLHARVESLSVKHAKLERTIEEEFHRPRPDELRVSRLKREKLRIKDELAQLRHH